MAFRVKLNPQDTLHWYRLLELCNNPEAKNIQELTNCIDNVMNIINLLSFTRDGLVYFWLFETV